MLVLVGVLKLINGTAMIGPGSTVAIIGSKVNPALMMAEDKVFPSAEHHNQADVTASSPTCHNQETI